MHLPPDNARLDLVVELMRNLSLQTDPQQAAALYGRGLSRLNLVPNDRYLSLSRRDLSHPQFRITRNTSWKEHPNPWKEKQKLPLLSGGLLAEILYSNQPAIITDLPSRLSRNDPAYDVLSDMKLLVALPHFDSGESINVGVLLNRSAEKFPFDDIPMMIWQANLWGRATLNLVNKQRLQAVHDAMDHELKVVADIQRSLLPRELPRMKNAGVAVHYQTSQRAGGDYYDFFPLPDDQWGIFLADVSGHGTPAAVLMAITHAIAHTRPGHPTPPEDLLAFVNRQLARHYTGNSGNFVTAIYAVYDPRGRSLTYASAGHPPPRLVRSGRILELDGESSLPLGIFSQEGFQRHTVTLQTNDRLVFYTDGITDTFNPEGDTFGTERLDEACLSKPAGLAEQFLSCLLAKLQEFARGAVVIDDRTLLIISIQ